MGVRCAKRAERHRRGRCKAKYFAAAPALFTIGLHTAALLNGPPMDRKRGLQAMDASLWAKLYGRPQAATCGDTRRGMAIHKGPWRRMGDGSLPSRSAQGQHRTAPKREDPRQGASRALGRLSGLKGIRSVLQETLQQEGNALRPSRSICSGTAQDLEGILHGSRPSPFPYGQNCCILKGQYLCHPGMDTRGLVYDKSKNTCNQRQHRLRV